MDEHPVLSEAPAFAVFRHAAALPEAGIPIMSYEPLTPVMAEGATRVIEAGINDGSETRLLFAAGGFSLSYAWFKNSYPLPRHAHDTDCLYYVVAGSLRMGTEDIGAGDGFFVAGGTPYSYTPGPAGVEVLEFRAGGLFDIKVLANNPAFWDKALQTVTDHSDAWKNEVRPSALTRV